MNRELLFTLIRSVLTAVGSFMFGKSLFGLDITPEWWETAIGAVLTIASVVWGIMDKTLTIEAWQSALRQIFVFVGGILVAIGKFTPEQFAAILGVLLVVANMSYSFLSKKKSEQVANEKINPESLKKLSP